MTALDPKVAFRDRKGEGPREDGYGITNCIFYLIFNDFLKKARQSCKATDGPEKSITVRYCL
jgi:hypothetical protein